MASFIVRATRTIVYEIPAEGKDAMDAIKQLDDWISDDFEGYEVSGRWDFEA
jgi:phosphotransferase system HPr-like phosphotransfer protein